MAYQNCVGRVGRLGVALGIGAAVATGVSAPAWADQTSTPSGTSASERAPAKSSSGAAGTRSAGRADGTSKRDPTHGRKPGTGRGTGKSKGVAEPSRGGDEATKAPGPKPGIVSAPEPAVAEQTPVLIAAVVDVSTDRSASTVDPLSPVHAPTMLAALAAARDELERKTRIQSANAGVPQQTALGVDTTPNVLVIGVDGTNLARILADPANVNFLEVMQGGTTAAASIAGHTTLSNPSWTAVLTGLWGETTGVINNIFNPGVYDKWPTVFNQLETLDPAIQTTAIADWDVVAAIAASGSVPADSVLYVPQVSGDTNWVLTDDAVGDATEAAIAAADPTISNFVFSYFVGVDENGHLAGGASPEYADAVQNIDRNLGEILQSVNAWEAATGEQWTIIMVTDHGHQPQLGFGHGFQSPDETTTFVIANNPDIFTAGAVNSQYQIIDVTPTVVSIFGGRPAAHSDGVSLTTLNGATTAYDSSTALFAALHAAIDDVDDPDPVTALALGARTIFASIPYFLIGFVDTITGELQGISDQGIPLAGPLAYLAIGPVQFAGDALYVATNVLAQVVARLTGVTGASIFPLLPPDLPDLQTPDLTTLVGVWCVPAVSGAASVCGAQSVAV